LVGITGEHLGHDVDLARQPTGTSIDWSADLRFGQGSDTGPATLADRFQQCVRVVLAEMPLVPHGSSLRFRTVAAQRELPSHKAVRDQALGVQGLGKCVVDCPPQRSVSVSPGLLKIRSGYFIDRASTEHRIGQRGSGMSHALLLVFA